MKACRMPTTNNPREQPRSTEEHQASSELGESENGLWKLPPLTSLMEKLWTREKRARPHLSHRLLEDRQKRGLPQGLGKRETFSTAPTSPYYWDYEKKTTRSYTLKPIMQRGPRGGMVLKTRGPILVKTDKIPF